MTTIMQQFNAICNHRFTKRIELRTQEQPLVAEHRGGTNSRMKRPQPQPAHTRYLSLRAEATLHGKIQGLVHATFMQPLQCVLQHHVANPHVFTHTATEHDNNHAAIPNAICNHRFKKRIELRTQEQPLVSEHRGGTYYARNDRSRNRRTHEVPFIRRQPLYTEKCKALCSGFLPKTKPMQHSCSHYNTFRSIT